MLLMVCFTDAFSLRFFFFFIPDEPALPFPTTKQTISPASVAREGFFFGFGVVLVLNGLIS